MKEKIIELREKGYSYSQIVEELGCSKSTVSYHLNEDTKKKVTKRTKERISRKLEKKVDKFKARLRSSIKEFQRNRKTKVKDDSANFGYKDVINKFGENTECYLTGRKINLLNDDFHFDHIIPVSKGGLNDLNNLEITCPEANMAKSSLLKEELISLCKEILEHNGFSVLKTD